MVNRNAALAIVTLLTLAGFALRLYHLDSVPLRGDEAFSAQNWAGRPLSESLAEIATIEPHPPLTYAIFRAWGVLFGIEQELTLRLLPALASLIGIPALYALGKRLHSPAVGILAALLWACHPFQIWHAQDFRNYALWAGMSAMTLWLALPLIEQRRPIDWLLYTVAILISLFTFYMELLTIATISLYVTITYHRERRFLVQWFALHTVIIAAISMTFLLFQGRLISSGGYAGTTGYLDVTQLITRFLPALTFGETLPGAFSRAAGIVLLLLLTGCAAIMFRYRPKSALFLTLLAVVPPLALAVISLKMGVFDPRYVLLASPAYVLLFCGGIVTVSQNAIAGTRPVSFASPQIQKIMIAVATSGWLLVCGGSLNLYWNDPLYRKAAFWNVVSDFLSENVTENDLVIQTAADAAFGYYYRSPALDIALPATFDQPEAEIIRLLEKYTAHHASTWMTGKTFPSWQNAGVVEAWLDEHKQLTRSTTAGGIPVRQYMDWQVSPDEIVESPPAIYADTIELAGARIFNVPDPTGNITVWLYWRPLQLTKTPLKIFVHLIGDVNPAAGAPLWAQSDAFPQQGRVNTDSWQPGTLYRDVYILDVRDLPAGTYQLMTGFYDPDTGERLTTNHNTDSMLIATITLR